MIELIQLAKSYRANQPVLNGVNVKIKDGSVFGLVGVNGAGKSTLLRLMAGVFKPDGGQVCVDGKNVYENEKIKRDIFFLCDEPYVMHNATPMGLSKFYRSVYHFDEGVFLEYLDAFRLNAKTPMRTLSKGMKRQVFVALAFAIAPKYLFLDEALDGLDPLARISFQRGLRKLVQEHNTTVVISSHSLRELESVCDDYGVLDNGKVISLGEMAHDLRQLHKFQAAFLHEVKKEDFDFECMSFNKTGKVVQCIAKGDKKEILDKLYGMRPIFVEEIAVEFEELFMYTATERGYLHA